MSMDMVRDLGRQTVDDLVKGRPRIFGREFRVIPLDQTERPSTTNLTAEISFFGGQTKRRGRGSDWTTGRECPLPPSTDLQQMRPNGLTHSLTSTGRCPKNTTVSRRPPRKDIFNVDDLGHPTTKGRTKQELERTEPGRRRLGDEAESASLFQRAKELRGTGPMERFRIDL